MDTATITKQVKQIISSITGIQTESIADSATYVDDLGLDSLAILEIAVDVEKAFGFRAQDDELQKIRSVQDSVNLILQHSCQQVA
jgi:acyl carrier protein